MARLTLSLLGALQITLNGEPLTKFGSINAQGILIYLALHPERPLSREVLAALFWPEEPDSRARANLRQNLHQLRKLLGDLDDPQTPFLLVTRHDVQLNPQSDYAVDVQQFLAAIEDHDLQTAVNSYQGDLLPGFTCDSAEFEDWLRLERESLHHLGMEALSELAQEQLDNGRLEEAAAGARRQLALEPWREAAFRQLMLAYALAGDRANALAQYERCREVLQEELGLEPTAETTALYEDIMAGRIGRTPLAEAVRPPLRVNNNLPAATTPLIGRDAELAQIKALILNDQRRLVTIAGPGGMGKTRLAQAAGCALLDQFPDGVYIVDLAPLAKAEDIPAAAAAALAFQAPDSSRDLFEQLLEFIGAGRILLILDNFEHLLSGAGLVNDLLHACPQTAVLVTSRQRLNLSGESRYELGGLAYADDPSAADALAYTAVQMFLDSARRVRPDFALREDNSAAVLRICRLVQGMPLGLMLAAAWLDLLSTDEIAVEIDKGLDFLEADLVDLPPRQRSMQAVFERSWAMMAPDEQSVLARLSVFRGGFDRQAAEEVAGADLRLLQRLVNKSLLQRETQDGRFYIHELLRQFAAARLPEKESAGETARAHCRYFARLVETEIRLSLDIWPIHLPRKRARDRDNIMCAWDHAITHGLAWELGALIRGVIMFHATRGILIKGLIEPAVAALRRRGLPETDHALRLLQLNAIIVRTSTENWERLKEEYLAFLDGLEADGEHEIRFWTLDRIAVIDSFYRRPEALAWAKKATLAALQTSDEVLINAGQVRELTIAFNLGRLDEVTEDKLLDLLIFFEFDYAQSVVVYELCLTLARRYLATGQLDEAIVYGRRALQISKGWEDLFWISRAADYLAEIYLQQGQQREAAAIHLDVLEWHLAIGQVWQTLGFIYDRGSNIPDLLGGYETAVPLLAMVYFHPHANAHYRHDIDRVLPAFKEEMGLPAFEAAWDRGREMGFETAVAQLRAALSRPS